ncbi:MAG: lytic transglycosylase domain-containing protein [Proteobacteria bacterium]|nr:lytic transglycosylase domain-containing protein [Pseudomonadota bacterium]
MSQPSQPPVHAPESIAGGQRGEIYSFDIDGVHRFATSLPPGVAVQNLRVIRYTFIETCFACGASDSEFRRLRVNREAYAPEIHAAAQEFGVEEALIRSIAHAESAFVPDVISRAGAQGVMQLMPDTAQRFGVTNTLNPAQSIRGGTQYLAWLIHRYPGHLDYAVAAYNAGEGAVDRYQGIPPFPETQRYVRRVEQLLAAYRGQP